MESDEIPEDICAEKIVKTGWRKHISIIVLFVINLLCYMDRFTVAGVLTEIQTYYNINDAQGGLIQTMFMVFYIVFSPTSGYLGDRYNRKWIMVVGIALWIMIVFASTFVPANMFWLFLILRGMVGIGEASYAIISPSVISDMYTGLERSRMLMFFYFAIPVGSGLGFIIASEVSTWLGHWQWGVRVTAILGVFCLAAIILVIEEPERGKAEREIGEIVADVKNTGYLEDIWELCKNTTYVTSTLGYTAIVFAVGTLAWWMPTVIEHKDAWKEGLNSTDQLSDNTKDQVNLIFGVITLLAGIVGVSAGTLISNWMSKGTGPFRYIQTRRSDAIVCGVGALIGVPTLFFGLYTVDKNMTVCWIMIFVCSTCLCFNWATNVDMLMSVVIPSRRNTANALQILTSHLLGDGSGPYVLGAISDAIRNGDDTPYGHFHSLILSFYIANVVLVFAVVLYAVAAFYFVRDQQKFSEEMGALMKPNIDVESIDKKKKCVSFSNVAMDMSGEARNRVTSLGELSLRSRLDSVLRF